MEFVSTDTVADLLREHGIELVAKDDRIHLEMSDESADSRLHLVARGAGCEPREGAKTIELEGARLADIVARILQRLHLNQVLLVPVGKWRKVFDAVAFSMAEHEEWREVDASATVALNTRNPLLCEAADMHLLHTLIGALMADAEHPDHGLVIIPIGAPLLIEATPPNEVLVSIGNPVFADEIAEICA